jgi:HAD superfamily hydrolase (TIGR01509 family)
MTAHNGAPDALLWDFDGVLADTEHVHHASWNAVLEPFGIQFTWPEYVKQCIGVADYHVAEKLGVPADVVPLKQQRFRQSLERVPPFLPETIELLHELASRFRMAVVSSSFRREIGPPIERAGLLPLFETIICGDDVQRLKPHPDPYLLAVERLGLRNPLVIEDSDSGVTAGKAAGLEVLRVSGVDRVANEVRTYLHT